MKKCLLLLLLLLPVVAGAQTRDAVNGIMYDFKDDAKASVVSHSDFYYSGDIVIPETVTYRGVTYTVTEIADIAFQECHELTSVAMPNTIKRIGNYAFYQCSALTSITLPPSLVEIGTSAFAESGLTELVVPNSVVVIGEGAFAMSASLTSVTLPERIISIPDRTFYQCPSLTSITIPNSVAWISSEAFYGCTSLASVTFPDNVNFSYINAFAFENCTSLTSVVIPNSVIYLWGGVFRGCTSLASVTLGSGLQYLNGQDFANCPNLKSVVCLAGWGLTAHSAEFMGSPVGSATLYVPSSSVSYYKSQEPWNTFGRIEPLKCAEPVITFENGIVTATCSTPGSNCELYAFFFSMITGQDVVIPEFELRVTATATADGFEPTEVTTTFGHILLGDMDGDGKLTPEDASRLASKILGK